MAESLIYISFHKLKGNQKTHLSRHLDIHLCNLACHFFAIVAELLARAKRVTRFNPLWLSADTKLEQGDHYYIQTRYKDLFSHYNLILRKL